MSNSNLCQRRFWFTLPSGCRIRFYPPNSLKVQDLQTFLISACEVCHRLKSDWKITRVDWRNKEKIGHLSSPNNHWQHRHNKLGQQKFIPHAHVGLVGHLSWHFSSLAHFPLRSPFFSTVQLELTSECKSWRNPDTQTENSTGSTVIPMPGNGGKFYWNKKQGGRGKKIWQAMWCNSKEGAWYQTASLFSLNS